MSNKTVGACFCGEVKIELLGEPEAMGYCHCTSCRQWSGDPIHAWTIWPINNVRVVAGESKLGTFQKTPDSLSHRQFCQQCGGYLMIHHPDLGVYDVFPGVLSDFVFEPAIHINCAEWVMESKDELPKFKDFPAEFEAFGGSGELMPE